MEIRSKGWETNPDINSELTTYIKNTRQYQAAQLVWLHKMTRVSVGDDQVSDLQPFQKEFQRNLLDSGRWGGLLAEELLTKERYKK